MKTTKLICPNCGAEFQIDEHEHVVCGIAIAEDSNLGTIEMPLKRKNKTQERLELLRKAGIDTSNFFAMNDRLITIDKSSGTAREIDESDPIIAAIIKGGTIRNAHLFKQHVMSMVLHNMVEPVCYWRRNETTKKQKDGYHFDDRFTKHVTNMSYEYSWQVLNDMLTRQSAMWLHENYKSYAEDNQFYNRNLAVKMIDDYMCQLHGIIKRSRQYKCKRRPYVKFCHYGELMKTYGFKPEGNPNYGLLMVGHDHMNLFLSIHKAKTEIENAKDPRALHHAVEKFVSVMPKLYIYGTKYPYHPTLCKEWIDAYKGYGSYFTMQNMILFHNCFLAAVRVEQGDKPILLNKEESLKRLDEMLVSMKGFELHGALRRFINYNNFDIEAKFKEWQEKYK